MKALYYFNPENDLALAANHPYFTPPAAAELLGRIAASLPVWYAGEGNYVYGCDDDKRWIDGLSKYFDFKSEIVTVPPCDIAEVRPWGWSEYISRLLSRLGVDDAVLPSSDRLSTYRELSHRRLTIDVYNALSTKPLPYHLPPCPIEINGIDNIEQMLNVGEHVYIKSPWSGSGRGVLNSMSAPNYQILRLSAGVIRRQGSVIVEKALDKVADFAMLYDMRDGVAHFVGYSLFNTDSHMTYSCNILLSDDAIVSKLSMYVDKSWLLATRDVMQQTLSTLLSDKYNGPLGVDMMIYRSNDHCLIAPCVEVNLRMTMGRVAHAIYSQFIDSKATGVMRIVRNYAEKHDDAVIERGKICGGTFALTPNVNSDIAMILQCTNA